ncbi:MAG: response regulator [Deltaproteobacteria bacterium]|nr:response regulator [Deltaproteobacteria bacterium]
MSHTPQTRRPLRVDYLSLKDFLEDYRKNLQQGRATVRSEHQLAAGEAVGLALSFPGLRQPLCLEARVDAVRALAETGYELDLYGMPPLQREALATAVARIAKRDPELFSPRQLRILVVEDNHHVAELIQRGLEGHLKRTKHALTVRVDLVEDASTALHQVEEVQYGLLLVDICLPLMAGDELIAQLRADERHQSLPIIALSASDDVERQALAAGANVFMHKPIRLKELLKTLSTLVPTLES